MIKKVLISILIVLVLGIGLVVFYSMYIRRIKLSDVNPPVEKTREAKVLSAFFGLDALPAQSLLLYWRGPGKNGMPLVFPRK